MRALIVEDDPDVAQLLVEGLRRHYAVDHCASAGQGLWLSETNPYDVIILDINLPDTSGIEMCSTLRKNKVTTPFLMLTGESDVRVKVRALDEGADDYLVKPFAFEELVARLKALRRRPAHLNLDEWLSAGDLRLNTTSRQLHYLEKSVPLRRRESELMEFMLRNREYTVTREQMFDHLWNQSSNVFSNSINVHLGHLRRKIHAAFNIDPIRTVHGVGYQLDFNHEVEAMK